jgi:hypothetical protein
MGEGGPAKAGPSLRRADSSRQSETAAEVASATQAGEGLCQTSFGGTVRLRSIIPARQVKA